MLFKKNFNRLNYQYKFWITSLVDKLMKSLRYGSSNVKIDPSCETNVTLHFTS